MKKTYVAVDLCRFIFSILVIVVHTYPFYDVAPTVGFISSNILGRLIIPFFFICAGYFFQKGNLLKDSQRFKKYTQKLIRLYLVWCLIFLPLGLYRVSYTINISPALFIPAAFVAMGTVGTYFHLWYMIALIGSCFFSYYFLKKFSLNSLLTLSGIFYLLGCVETYYGVLPLSIQNPINFYFSIFFTTRNAIFLGIFLFAIGLWIAQQDLDLKIKHPFRYFLFSLIVFFIEAFQVRSHGWAIDYNFYLSLIPVSIFWFIFLLHVELKEKWNSLLLRQYSVIIYLSHGIFLELVPLFLKLIHSPLFSNGAFRLFSVLIPTLILSYFIKNYLPQLQ